MSHYPVTNSVPTTQNTLAATGRILNVKKTGNPLNLDKELKESL